jgi:hypothetical protein
VAKKEKRDVGEILDDPTTAQREVAEAFVKVHGYVGSAHEGDESLSLDEYNAIDEAWATVAVALGVHLDQHNNAVVRGTKGGRGKAAQHLEKMQPLFDEIDRRIASESSNSKIARDLMGLNSMHSLAPKERAQSHEYELLSHRRLRTLLAERRALLKK